MQIIELEKVIISKFETDMGENEDTAGEFLNNLLEIYPGKHDCIHAKSNQICEDRKETAMLLWHKGMVQYGNLKLGVQRICSMVTQTLPLEVIMHNVKKHRQETLSRNNEHRRI